MSEKETLLSNFKISTVIVYTLAVLLIGGCLGYMMGRSYFKESVDVKLVKGDPIKVTVDSPKVVKETPPKDKEVKVLPVFKDTSVKSSIPQEITDKIDSLESVIKTLRDWNTLRNYEYAFSDKKYGDLGIKFDVQYNKVVSPISLDIEPLKEVVTKKMFPTWKPFVGYTWTTLDYHILEAGTFYHNLGISAVYINDLKGTQGYGFGIKWTP